MGYGLTGKKLGLIGLGNIGSEVVRLATPFGLRFIAHDPYVDPTHAAGLSVELVDLETLLSTADIVTIHCALTPETRHLLNADHLALMKSTAFLINTARGPIVDQAALTNALSERRIRGAGLDVFEQEPVDPSDPLLKLDNVMLTPHALCWTDGFAYITGRSVVESIIAIANGNVPKYVVNKEVVDVPAFQAKLARFCVDSA
jgi:D-3-phosphoglycerate dehydrogenase